MREIGLKRKATRIQTYASLTLKAEIAYINTQEAPGELSIVLVSHGLPP